jgi:hypothetical protein
MSGLVVGKPHRLITVLFHVGLMLRGFLHVLFVQGARLHVLCRELQPAE